MSEKYVMPNTLVLNHPMIEHKMATIRDKNTSMKEFTRNVYEVSLLVAYKVSENFLLKEKEIETPICKCKSHVLAKDIIIVPILRAGLGFVDGFREIIPEARVGYLGMYRDEQTLKPIEYCDRLPKDLSDFTVIISDPMLATGGSALLAIDAVKARGAKDIIFAGLVGAPEGVDAVYSKHPDVKVVLATLDEKLNEHGYIVPGLGDCGDRLYGKN